MAQWQTLSDRINHVTPSATLAVDSKAKAMKAAGLDVVGFGAGEPNFPTPDYVVDAAAAACRDPKNYKYTPTPGLPELRSAIAAKTLRDSGYEVAPEQVVVTNGGKQAVYSTFQILLDEGDEVIIPTPYWTSYPEAVKLAGGVPVEVFAGADCGFEPDLEAIEAARTERTKAIIVTSPNNPTGAVWSPETIEGIAKWAIEHHVWVISDEIYEHLNYDDAHTTYIGTAVPEVRDQLIVLNGVAKTYAMPGWRVGWLIAPEPVAKAAAKLQGHMTSNVANVSQRAAIAAVSGPLDAVYRMREAFDVRRKAIVAALNDIDGVNCPTPTGAFYAFADITALLGKPLGPNGTVSNSSAEFAAALLDEAHVAAVPGEAFGAPGYLRFSYALADDQLAEGMRRMKAYVEA
ncbi:pyridoxal phosphate-dependent aminotransferase [Bifidobacterium aesculapii]|uniref:pyridoxal phosphate-dependent aminotransferase n=1 Tax=Bifidobacterium aesculapii TaxID=1329411 RepID=UPI0006E36F12|nr:pyridoxal phosphate-dependent aminotransferase [Bifidobacterium aesculapii]